MSFLRDHKDALLFLLLFLSLCVAPNSLHGLLITSCYPTSDPFVQPIAWLLSLGTDTVNARPFSSTANVALSRNVFHYFRVGPRPFRPAACYRQQFHRLIINPTLMILLIPAIYFQKLKRAS